MRTRNRILVGLVSAAILVMPGTAAAEPLPQPDWEAAYNASADASGAFAPGTDFSILSRTEESGASYFVTVHVDGSLQGERVGEDGMDRIRCVRIDRCWEQSAVTFGDSKWHRLPAGSVVYMDARAYWWSEVMEMPWPESSFYAIEPDPDGMPMHMVGWGNEAAVRVSETTFTPGTATAVHVMMVNDTPIATTVTVGMAKTGLAPVRAPAKSTIGKRATLSDYWSVPINPPAG